MKKLLIPAFAAAAMGVCLFAQAEGYRTMEPAVGPYSSTPGHAVPSAAPPHYLIIQEEAADAGDTNGTSRTNAGLPSHGAPGTTGMETAQGMSRDWRDDDVRVYRRLN